MNKVALDLLLERTAGKPVAEALPTSKACGAPRQSRPESSTFLSMTARTLPTLQPVRDQLLRAARRADPEQHIHAHSKNLPYPRQQMSHGRR